MADEFVEVVNTTITETELPSNNSTHTLKTAGANESFALKDIAIKTSSTLAEYSFLLNDFETLSFPAGESGVASGLDLIPKSGTLKIKGKNIPIKSESLLFSVDKGGSSLYSGIKETVVSGEFSLADKTKFNFSNNYETIDNFADPYTNATGWNNYWSYAWKDGDRFRAIRGQTSHTSQGRFEYAETAGGSISYIEKYSFEYVPELNKIFYMDNASGNVKVSNTDSAISFSTFHTPVGGNWTSTLARCQYNKGWLFLFENPISDYDPDIYAVNVTSGIQLRFTGSGTYYTGGSSTSTAMGYCISYDPSSDSFSFYRTSYQTSDPMYISKATFPKTLTEMNAYASNTTISDNFTSLNNSFTRTAAAAGPFAYQFPHYLRGSESNGNIFYLCDPSTTLRTLYVYDFDANTLTSLNVGYSSGYGLYNTRPLIQKRAINAADENQYGGSFSDVDVRVTGIQTT